MDLSSAILLYFSPTRTTRAILEGITGGMPSITKDHVDLTPPDALKHELVIANHAVVPDYSINRERQEDWKSWKPRRSKLLSNATKEIGRWRPETLVSIGPHCSGN